MAKDIGSSIVDWIFTTDGGLFLVGVLLAAILKYFWRSRVADQLREEYDDRKYVVYAIISILGFVLLIINVNDIVRAVGFAILGIGISNFFLDAWEEKLFPFIKLNTNRVIVTVFGVLLLLFSGSLESVLGFPQLITIVLGCLLVLGMWWSHISSFYSRLILKYPNLDIRNIRNIRKVFSDRSVIYED